MEFHLFLCAFVYTAGLEYSHVPRCWKFGVCRVWLCWVCFIQQEIYIKMILVLQLFLIYAPF